MKQQYAAPHFNSPPPHPARLARATLPRQGRVKEIRALDHANTPEIEQMRTPAFFRHRRSPASVLPIAPSPASPAARADPVAPQRRQFLGAAGIGPPPVARRKHSAHQIAPAAAARARSRAAPASPDGSARRCGLAAALPASRRARPRATIRPDRSRQATRSSARPVADCNRSTAASPSSAST